MSESKASDPLGDLAPTVDDLDAALMASARDLNKQRKKTAKAKKKAREWEKRCHAMCKSKNQHLKDLKAKLDVESYRCRKLSDTLKSASRRVEGLRGDNQRLRQSAAWYHERPRSDGYGSPDKKYVEYRGPGPDDITFNIYDAMCWHNLTMAEKMAKGTDWTPKPLRCPPIDLNAKGTWLREIERETLDRIIDELPELRRRTSDVFHRMDKLAEIAETGFENGGERE